MFVPFTHDIHTSVDLSSLIYCHRSGGISFRQTQLDLVVGLFPCCSIGLFDPVGYIVRQELL